MLWIHRTCGIFVIGVVIATVGLGSFGALSNPVGPSPSDVDTTFRIGETASGIALLMLMNILVNLFWTCVLLLFLGKRYGVASMTLPRTGLAFVVRVLSVAALVTLIGAYVDYAFVLGIDPDYSEYWRVIQLDVLNWLVAIGIIFLSIVGAAYLVLGMSTRPLLILAGVITLLNPVWWLLTRLLGNDVPMMTIFLSALILPIALKGLLDLHGHLTSASMAQMSAKARGASGSH